MAVIDLSDSGRGAELADALNVALNNHDDLKPLNNPSLTAELIGTIVDDDAQPLVDERQAKRDAEDALRRGDFPRAATIAKASHGRLALKATPTPAVVKLYAELAFLLGHARLGERKADDAATAFRLAHALDPAFRPDPAFTFPEIVEAFDKAVAANPGMGQIGLTGTGRVFLDGKDQGILNGTRQTFEATAGSHVVWLVGPERDTRGKELVVVATKKTEDRIEDAPSTEATLVRRARVALKTAPDPSAHSSALRRLAVLVKAHDAILVTAGNGKLVVQIWRDRAPGFEPPRELATRIADAKLGDADKPLALLEPLAPPKRIAKPDIKKPEGPKTFPKPEGDPWYTRPRYWWVGGGVVAAIVVGSIYMYATRDREIGFTQPSFDGNDTGARR